MRLIQAVAIATCIFIATWLGSGIGRMEHTESHEANHDPV